MAPLLLKAGHQLAGLDSDLYAASTFGGGMADIPTTKKDVRDVTTADVEGFDAVIHLAALSNDPLGDLDPALTDEINHLASVKLARVAKQAGVRRFIFSSSCSNYGAAGEDILNENSAFNPVTPYGRSKVDTEREVSLLADEKFCPTFMRSATAYGVSPRLRFDLVLNNLVAWAYTTSEVMIKSDGTAWRPVVHIEDISRAFLAALEAPVEAVHNQAFNVGRSTENYRVSELAEIVRQTVPNCKITYAPGGQPDTRCYRVTCDKITATLPAFQPRWTARRGAQELYTSYRSVGLVLNDFEGPRYKRVAHLKLLMEQGKLDSNLRWKYQTMAVGQASRPVQLT